MSLLFWTTLVCIFYSYIGYPVLLFLLANFFSRKRVVDTQYCPRISMLVAAYNEESNILIKIDNFTQINYPANRMEIIIGSDGSNDGTNKILTSYSNEQIRPILYNKRRGKAAVLNDIVKKASGDILIFSDANTIYDKNAIHKLVRYFSDSKIGGVCGKLVLLNPNSNLGGTGEQLYWNYENFLKKYEGKFKTVLGANGAIYALRKDLYQPLPEDKVIMDDFIVPLKAVEQGYDVIYDDEAFATETTSPDVKGEFQRKIRIGAANYNAIKEIKKLLNPKRGFVAFGLWSHKIFRWFIPFLLIIVFVTNIFLLSHTFYILFMFLQILFYLTAFFGYLLNNSNYSIKILFYPFYFCTINLALAIGFYKYLTQSQKPAWKRVERL